MGTEILLLFIPVPLFFWAWNLWQLRSERTRSRNLVMLVLGMAFMAYMCLPVTSDGQFTTRQYLVQGLAAGGFFYAPLYLVTWAAVSAAMKRWPWSRKKSSA